jgi:hypothetical protein
MYGEVEVYTKTTTSSCHCAVSIWINRNKKDKVISAIRTHMIKLDFLIYERKTACRYS